MVGGERGWQGRHGPCRRAGTQKVSLRGGGGGMNPKRSRSGGRRGPSFAGAARGPRREWVVSRWGLGTGDTGTHHQPVPQRDGRQRPSHPRRMLSDRPIWGATTGTTTHLGSAGPQKSPQSFRLFLMMTSVTASKTNCTFLVSVAQVKWV